MREVRLSQRYYWGHVSSGMWCCVAGLVDHSAFISQAKHSGVLWVLHLCRLRHYIPLKCQNHSFVELFQPALDGHWLSPAPTSAYSNRPNSRCASHSRHVPGSREPVSRTQGWGKTTMVTSPKHRNRLYTSSCLLLSQRPQLNAGLSQSRTQVSLFSVSATMCINQQSITWTAKGIEGWHVSDKSEQGVLWWHMS